MRVASIALGVVAYFDQRLVSSQVRLHFATDDAYAFHSYASAAWSGDLNLHLCLTDEKASRNELEKAIEKVAKMGRLDLFLLYLSGHGEVRANQGWFCLADARSDEPSLTSMELDRLLSMIDAHQVLVIADYCYAEASLADSHFFGTLGGRSARLYIASARSTQKAWEDSELKRSIFSDVLLKAMASGSPLAEQDGTVDVQARLIPHLREQVPLEAASRKRGAVQEPVAGGVAAESNRLPTVAARDMRRNLSISDTLRMRLRRILAVSLLLTLSALIVTDLLVYHLAIDANGAIIVRSGFAALHRLTPIHLGTEVQTDFSVRELSPRNPEAFRGLSRGSTFGFTTRKDIDGLTLWLTQLEPMLVLSSASRARMLARANTPQLKRDDAPPVSEAAFIAYAAAKPRRVIADQIYPDLPSIDVDCGRAVGTQIDFSLLDLSSDVFARDLGWRALRIEGVRHQSELIQMVTAVTYRTAHAKDAEQIGRDIEALADAVRLIPLRSLPLLPKSTGWCEGVPAAMMRVLTVDDQIGTEAEAALVAYLPSVPLPPGTDLPLQQMSSIAALTALVSRATLKNHTVEGIVAAFDKSGERLGLDTPLNHLLFETAANHPLPQHFRTKVFELLGREEDEANFAVIEGFRLLARNANYLTSVERSALRTWLNRKGEANRTLSRFHEGLGYLSLSMPLRSEEISWLVARLSPYSFLPRQATSYRGETIISASDGEAAVALARVNQRQTLEREVIERLLTIAAQRTDLHDRQAMLRGLGFAKERIDREIVEGLSSKKTSALMRVLYKDIAVAQLRIMPHEVRTAILMNLFQYWQRSRAPELRMALGEIIGRVMAEGREKVQALRTSTSSEALLKS